MLRSESGKPINRLFVIEFPDKSVMEAFFSDPDYLAVRERHFNSSVAAVTEISLHGDT